VDGEKLGVAVLAYGREGQHLPLVEALLAECVPISSLTVVHNPAEPGEPPAAAPAGCEVIRCERNLGYAGGMNRGIEALLERGFDLILLLTHDARLRSGALAALLEATRRRRDFGVLGPALVLAGEETPFSFGGITRRSGTNAHIRARPDDAEGGVISCDWIDGGAMLVRRDVLEGTGGFDERFWGYFEEADLCLRVRRSGARVGVAVDAVMDQAPGGSRRPGAWSYLLTRNGTEYARRAVGVRGVLGMTLRTTWNMGYELMRAGLRWIGLRHGDPGEPWAIAVGAGRGLIDYFRGRWGPPPSDLPGMGDVQNV